MNGMIEILAQVKDARDPYDWVRDFVPFSMFHLATVFGFAAVMAASCKYGRKWHGAPKEERFRKTWGWAILVYQVWFTLGYLFPKTLFFPKPFSWEESLPLQVCDLAAFVAGAAMVWQFRWLRTMLYFWGIGLSTQAFFTPTLRTGLGSAHYWMFWIGHTMIVGSAVYDVVVRRYRPTLKDFGVALAISVGYTVMAFTANTILDRSGLLAEGVVSNYGYIGKTAPKNPTVIDKLGPWPGRVFKMVGIVIVDYILIWGVWRIAALFHRGGPSAGAPPPAARE